MILKFMSANGLAFSMPNISLDGKKMTCTTINCKIQKDKLRKTHRALESAGK